jgi:hypothetical protein
MASDLDMNTVQNGKGDRPRNNWGPTWYSGYAAVDWRRRQQPAPVNSSQSLFELAPEPEQAKAEHYASRQGNPQY